MSWRLAFCMATEKAETDRVPITLALQTIGYLEKLVKQGTHGTSVPGVARTLVEEGIRLAIKDGLLSIRDNGKLSRLNLTREKTIDLRRRARKSAKGTVKGPRLKTTPRLQYRMLQAVYAEPEVLFDDDTIGEEHRCSLLELSEQRCRWPISTPGAEDFCFCGNTPVEGLPYCPGHTRLAYRPSSRAARG